jgi:hypothetical protein
VAYDAAKIDAMMGTADDRRAAIEFPAIVAQRECLMGSLFTVVSDDIAVQTVMANQPLDRRVDRVVGVGAENFPVTMTRATYEKLGGFNMDFCLRLGLVEFVVRALAQDPTSVVLRLDWRFNANRELMRLGKDADAQKEAEWFRKNVGHRRAVLPSVPGNEIRIPPPMRHYEVASGRLMGAPIFLPFVSRKGRPLRFQIMCPAPADPSGITWGDYHFAASLKRALEASGHHCGIRLRDHWAHRSHQIDVAIHIRGIVDVKPVPGALNLIWIISHPDKIQSSEMQGAAGVFASSEALKVDLKRRFGINAYVMPQAVDAARFAFVEAAPIRGIARRFLFIGNSRRQPRPIVLDSIELGLPLEVYGGDWEFYISPEYIRGTFIPNDAVAAWYRSAGCTLNDHWPAMAEAGIISNRLLDVVAAGGIAISDEVPGIQDLFAGHVRTYRTKADLADLARNLADWAPRIERRRELSRAILAEHAFDVRARQFITFVAGV